MRWGVKESSLRAGKLISFCSRSLRLPSGGCLADATARPDRRGKIKKITPFFLEAEGVTHLRVFFVDMLIGCEVHEYRCRIIEAIVNRVLPREVAQAAMVPTTLVSRSLVRDVGKELPRDNPVILCSLGQAIPKHDWKPSQHAHVPGIPSGTTIIPTRSQHMSSFVLFLVYYLDLSSFPSIIYNCRLLFCMERTLFGFFSDGFVLPCDHRLDVDISFLFKNSVD